MPERTQKRIRVLVNPSAHSRRGPKTLKALWTRVQSQNRDVRLEWVESRSAAHFIELVQAAQDPAEELCALGVAGGDGTVTLALRALLPLGSAARVPLGVLPVGSGNDFSNDIGASRSLETAFATLLAGEPRRVDVGEVQSESGPAYFCCVASVGLDELALRRIHGSRLPRSKALNIYSALRALIAYRPAAVDVRWQGGGFSGEMMFCAVTNTRSYGGGFQVSPAARVDDGMLDLCIVRRVKKTRLLRQFPRILKGTHGDAPEVILAQSPWVEIGTPGLPRPGLPLCIDGELPSGGTPCRVRCLPGAILVMTPQSEALGQRPAAA
jgi:diacylglycerol kinase (ATP)